jgi:hypothetical protein
MKQEVPCRLEVGKWWKLVNSCLCCECVAEIDISLGIDPFVGRGFEMMIMQG